MAKKPPADTDDGSLPEGPVLDEKAARQKVYGYLARRDYSSGELRNKLIDKGFERGIVDALIEALKRERALDDNRYLEQFVSYHAGRGQGPVRITHDLRALGFDSESIAAALEGFTGDWAAEARRQRAKKFGATAPSDYADKAKQARFLQYRGFTGAQIRSALGTDIEIDDET